MLRSSSEPRTPTSTSRKDSTLKEHHSAIDQACQLGHTTGFVFATLDSGLNQDNASECNEKEETAQSSSVEVCQYGCLCWQSTNPAIDRTFPERTIPRMFEQLVFHAAISRIEPIHLNHPNQQLCGTGCISNMATFPGYARQQSGRRNALVVSTVRGFLDVLGPMSGLGGKFCGGASSAIKRDWSDIGRFCFFLCPFLNTMRAQCMSAAMICQRPTRNEIQQ